MTVETISVVLANAQLDSFAGKFQAEGIESVSDLMLLTDDDMRELGLNIGQRNRLKKHLKSQSSDVGEILTNEARIRYEEIFDAIDTDKSGEIDFDEFIEALKKLDVYQSDTDARRIFNAGDLDGGGTLDRDEFVQLLHSATPGGRNSHLAKLAKASDDVLDQLRKTSGICFTINDVLDAEITDEALGEAQNYSTSYTWLPDPKGYNGDKKYELFFGLILLDVELARKIIEVICVGMLEDLENKLRECGISGFVTNCVKVDAVVEDGLRNFALIAHRYSYMTTNDESYVNMPWGMSYIHSFRKAAAVVGSNQSVDEVREVALSYLQSQAMTGSGSSNSQDFGYQNRSGSGVRSQFAAGFGSGAGEEVASQIMENGGLELAMGVLEGVASTGCNVM